MIWAGTNFLNDRSAAFIPTKELYSLFVSINYIIKKQLKKDETITKANNKKHTVGGLPVKSKSSSNFAIFCILLVSGFVA